MPGLLGYMLAIVVMLGGYFAGLHWLLNPPDPWQPNPKAAQVRAQQVAAKKRAPPVIQPAEADVVADVPASTVPHTALASVEVPASVQASGKELAKPLEQNAVKPPPPAEASRQLLEPIRVARHDVAPTRSKSVYRKRAEKNQGRKLELMVLRTYERSDGKRFTRLLPMNSTRSALAFQPDDQW